MADSVFPFIDATVADSETAISTDTTPKEYDWDFDNNDFKLVNGKPVIVEGTDALKIWILKVLQTQRYRYPAYTWDYGHEIEDLIGEQLSTEATEAEAERYLKEALLVNSHITSIKDVSVTLDGSKVSIDFTAVTDQGEDVDVSV